MNPDDDIPGDLLSRLLNYKRDPFAGQEQPPFDNALLPSHVPTRTKADDQADMQRLARGVKAATRKVANTLIPGNQEIRASLATHAAFPFSDKYKQALDSIKAEDEGMENEFPKLSTATGVAATVAPFIEGLYSPRSGAAAVEQKLARTVADSAVSKSASGLSRIEHRVDPKPATGPIFTASPETIEKGVGPSKGPYSDMDFAKATLKERGVLMDDAAAGKHEAAEAERHTREVAALRRMREQFPMDREGSGNNLGKRTRANAARAENQPTTAPPLLPRAETPGEMGDVRRTLQDQGVLKKPEVTDIGKDAPPQGPGGQKAVRLLTDMDNPDGLGYGSVAVYDTPHGPVDVTYWNQKGQLRIEDIKAHSGEPVGVTTLRQIQRDLIERANQSSKEQVRSVTGYRYPSEDAPEDAPYRPNRRQHDLPGKEPVPGYNFIKPNGGIFDSPANDPLTHREPPKPDLPDDPNAPEKVVSAAVRTKDGKVFTGTMHIEARQKAADAGSMKHGDLTDRGDLPKGQEPPDTQDGFVTNKGRFVQYTEGIRMQAGGETPPPSEPPPLGPNMPKPDTTLAKLAKLSVSRGGGAKAVPEKQPSLFQSENTVSLKDEKPGRSMSGMTFSVPTSGYDVQVAINHHPERGDYVQSVRLINPATGKGMLMKAGMNGHPGDAALREIANAVEAKYPGVTGLEEYGMKGNLKLNKNPKKPDMGKDGPPPEPESDIGRTQSLSTRPEVEGEREALRADLRQRGVLSRQVNSKVLDEQEQDRVRQHVTNLYGDITDRALQRRANSPPLPIEAPIGLRGRNYFYDTDPITDLNRTVDQNLNPAPTIKGEYTGQKFPVKRIKEDVNSLDGWTAAEYQTPNGNVNVEYQVLPSGEIRVHMIGVHGKTWNESPGTVGARAIREIQRDIESRRPDAETLGGSRITGANGEGDGPFGGRLVKKPIKRPPTDSLAAIAKKRQKQ